MIIPMTDSKMIYKDQIFDVLSVNFYSVGSLDASGEAKIQKKIVEACVLDSDGKIKFIEDEPDAFKFLRK